MNRDTVERYSRDLRHAIPTMHHLLSGPTGPEHAVMILGGLVLLLVIVSAIGYRMAR